MRPLSTQQIHTRPASALVAAIRDRHGFTQVQCAYIVACTARSWAIYESRDGSMPLAAWWLFLLRIGEIREPHLPNIPPRQRASAVLAVGIWPRPAVNHPL